MPKTTASDRITRYIHAYGLATSQELQDKFDVSHSLVSQTIGYELAKTPPFIMSKPGKGRRWIKTTQAGTELKGLLHILSHLQWMYLQTHHERYHKYAVITARKLLAVAYEIYVKIETTTVSGVRPQAEEDKNSKIADDTIALIRKCLSTGNPQLIMGEDK